LTQYIVAWLIAANLIAFVLMILDKRRAAMSSRRISESTLLGWACLGGAPGTFAASRLVRHKTRKQPFAVRMIAILIFELALLALWALGILRSLLASGLAIFTTPA
jgi:uncharacterized membrane protein YsdA (DUF1294 family)